MVKRNPAFAVPTLGLEELLTAAHDTMHGLKELLTPIHGMAAPAGSERRLMGTPDTPSSAVKSAMLRIANGCRADCAQDKRAREREAQERDESKREKSAKKNSVRATMNEAASKE